MIFQGPLYLIILDFYCDAAARPFFRQEFSSCLGRLFFAPSQTLHMKRSWGIATHSSFSILPQRLYSPPSHFLDTSQKIGTLPPSLQFAAQARCGRVPAVGSVIILRKVYGRSVCNVSTTPMGESFLPFVRLEPPLPFPPPSDKWLGGPPLPLPWTHGTSQSCITSRASPFALCSSLRRT
jgi:hypothetical protein